MRNQRLPAEAGTLASPCLLVVLLMTVAMPATASDALDSLVAGSVPSVAAEAARKDAVSLSLLSAWDAALRHDAVYQRALAERDVSHEELALGRSQLLPQINLTGSLGQARTTSERLGPTGPVGQQQKYDTESWALQLRQPLFRPRAWVAYAQGKVLDAQGEQQLRAARQDLALRLLDATAGLLEAEAGLRAAELVRTTQGQLVVLATRQRQAGEGTRVQESRTIAAHDQARRDVLSRRAEREQARQLWRRLVGTLPAPVQTGKGLVETLTLPGEGDLRALLALAERHNPAFASARAEVELARLEARRARGERLPTVDLVSSRSFNDSESDNIIGSSFDTTRVAVQASLPLFTGGALSATIRQKDASLRVAEARLTELRERAHALMATDVLRHEEARAALAAATSALQAARDQFRQAELGRIAGTATLAEFVEAEVARVNAERDEAQALAALLRAWARVHETTGLLQESLFELLDDHLIWVNALR